MKKLTVVLLLFFQSHVSAQYVFTGFDIFPWVGYGCGPQNFHTADNKLYFTSAYGFYGFGTSDGTLGGTYWSFNPEQIEMANLTPFNHKLLFYDYDPTYGYELFITDGTIPGTQMVKDVYVGSSSSGPVSMINLNDSFVLFSPANFPLSGELWRTDGTDTGTYMVKDIYPGIGVGWPRGFTELNGKAYFSANDGVNGTELWVSDGTASGTQLVVDIVPGSGSSDPLYFNRVGDSLFFLTNAGAYLTDGTAAGTIHLGQGGYHYTRYHDKFYSSDEFNIYQSDGTNGSASVFLTGEFLDTASHIAVFNDRMFFYNYGEPWISDGTVGGSHMIKDLCPSGYSMPRCFTTFNNRVFFIANDACMSVSLFISDGTVAGTYPIMPLSINQFNPLNDTYELYVMDSCMYFLAHYNDIGPELWQICGTDTSAYHVNYAGISTQQEQPDINVFPNPTSSMIYFTSGENISNASACVYDLNGKILITQSNLSTLQLDLSDLAPGMYLIGVTKDNKESFVRIIKQ